LTANRRKEEASQSRTRTLQKIRRGKTEKMAIDQGELINREQTGGGRGSNTIEGGKGGCGKRRRGAHKFGGVRGRGRGESG